MVDIKREGFSLLLKLGHSLVVNEPESPTEETPVTSAKTETPMVLFWESDKLEKEKNNQPYKDSFDEDVGLDTIPDTTEEPVVEYRYDFDQLSRIYLSQDTLNYQTTVGPETPKVGTGVSPGGRDAGVVAGIVVAVITGVIILVGLIAALMYRHYMHRNVTSMNFDNPVYRKTTEDQLVLEKNGYAPGSKLYPSTVGEEAQEPLNSPSTNDFV